MQCGKLHLLCSFICRVLCFQKNTVYTNVSKQIAEFENDEVIMFGDRNFVLNPELDTENYVHANNPNARRIILNYMEEESLLDVWRIMNGNCKKFTWRRLNTVRTQARLDYFLVSESLPHYVTEADFIAGYRTDHNDTILKLKLIENIRGKGYWKFNNFILKDNEYIDIVKQTITEVKDTYKINDNIVNANVNTVDSRYLEFQRTLWNTSIYLYLNISDLQNWWKNNSHNHI